MGCWSLLGNSVVRTGVLVAAFAVGAALNMATVEDTLAAAPAAPPPTSAELYTSVYNGWKWWHVYCYRCHGTNAIAGTLAPDLRDPKLKWTEAQFVKIVQNGFPDDGMQAWDKLLTEKQISQLYYYVIARSDKVLPVGRPDEVGPNGGQWVPPAGWPKPR
jgi:mono/diheme cytochrome c family protein